MTTGKGKKNKNGGIYPEMKGTGMTFEQSIRQGHGMSMDLGNPYLLPAGIESRESLHSMTRNIGDRHDPYKPAAVYNPNGTPIKSYANSRHAGDDSSSSTGSSGRTFRLDNMNQNLIGNAQQMSRSGTPQDRPPQIQGPAPIAAKGLPSNPRPGAFSPNGLRPSSVEEQRDSYVPKDNAAMRQSNNYLASFIQSREPSINPARSTRSPSPRVISGGLPSSPSDTQARRISQASNSAKEPVPEPIRKFSLPPTPPMKEEDVNYYNSEGHHQIPHVFSEVVIPPSPIPEIIHQYATMDDNPVMYEEYTTPFFTPNETNEHQTPGGLEVSNLPYDPRRLSILRPLPPNDPSDNPEQRANRIRSFYKEYFNDDEPARGYESQPAAYYEDYDQSYLGEGSTFDPVSGQYVVANAPYAEPITRRAMTPPPRGPPRFQGSPGPQFSRSNHSSQAGGPRSRAVSSASTSRLGPGGNRGPQKRHMPPPAALRTLPTPHLLREAAFGAPIDFAPPSTYRDRQAGRPESPFAELRPFSPQVPVANNLYSAFDELPGIPSP